MGPRFGITVGVDLWSIKGFSNATVTVDAAAAEAGLTDEQKDQGSDERKAKEEKDPADPGFRTSPLLGQHPDDERQSDEEISEEDELAEQSVISDLLQDLKDGNPGLGLG